MIQISSLETKDGTFPRIPYQKAIKQVKENTIKLQAFGFLKVKLQNLTES